MPTPRPLPFAPDDGQTVLYRRSPRPCRACPYRHVPEDTSGPPGDTTGAGLPMPPLATITLPPPGPRSNPFDRPADLTTPLVRRRPPPRPNHNQAYLILNLVLILLILIGLVLLAARTPTTPRAEDHAPRRT